MIIIMKQFRFLAILMFVGLLTGCNDEPQLPYSIEVDVLPYQGEFQENGDQYTCNLNGLAWGFRVIINGEYDSFESSMNDEEWYGVFDDPSSGWILINFERLLGEEQPRSFSFDVSVTANGKTKKYYFTVTQYPTTDEDLLALEPKALESFVAHHRIEKIPYNYDYMTYDLVKDYAPYYKISSDPEAYMQVQSLGKGKIYTPGDPVAINYEIRYDHTMCYYYGCDSDPFKARSSSDNQNSSEDCGPGMLLPLEHQLPLGTTVSLILPNSIQPPLEARDNRLYEFLVTYLPE